MVISLNLGQLKSATHLIQEQEFNFIILLIQAKLSHEYDFIWFSHWDHFLVLFANICESELSPANEAYIKV